MIIYKHGNMKHFGYLFLGGVLLIVCSCSFSTSNKEDKSVSPDTPSQIEFLELPKTEALYVLKERGILDSTLFISSEFSLFQKSIETIKELNPQELDFYLSASVQETDKLLKTTLHKMFESPLVKSRLRVIKTQLLKCRYFSQENDIVSLKSSLIDLFDSYNIFLKRIDAVAQSQKELNENVFEITK